MECEWNFNWKLPPSFRYDDIRSPQLLQQSISQMSLYNNSNAYPTSGGIIEPLPFHHRPVPIPPTRSLISDYNSGMLSRAERLERS